MHAHVRATVAGMVARGEEITFGAVAAQARVSRRTLYIHWSMMAELAADALFTGDEPEARALFARAAADPIGALPALMRELIELRNYRVEVAHDPTN